MPGSPQRRELERQYVRAVRSKYQKELERRTTNPNLAWARSFAGNPHGFFREIMGKEADGTWTWDGPDWVAWRPFISAIFGLPITDEQELAIFKDCTGLEEAPTHRSREVWAPIGRRGGKTRVFSILAAHFACCYDWSKYLVPGEYGTIPILAESRDRAAQAMSYVRATFLHPRLQHFLARPPLSEEIYLKGNILIRVTTASIAAARSRTVLLALCDEVASWKKEESANPDKDILDALRPAMLTIPGSMLCGLSSPYARKGVLWEAYRDHYGLWEGRRRPWDEWNLVWKAPTWVMHPKVEMVPIRKAYQDDSASAGAEYGAEFRTDVEAFLTQEAWDACVEVGCLERAPVPGFQYVAFVDPSGGIVDSFTLAIAHREGNVAVLDLVREVTPSFNPDSVTEQYCNEVRAYGITFVRGDHYAGEWPRASFRENGLEYEPTDSFKSEIYLKGLPLINSKRCRLLDHRRLSLQSVNLERKTSRGGRDSIDHPPGGHDDISNAVFGALVMCMEDEYQMGNGLRTTMLGG